MDFESIAYAQQVNGGGSAPAQGGFMVLLPMYLIILAVFYFFLIRPQQKQQQEKLNMVSQLKKNDEVVTAGGIHGTIVNVKETTVVLKVDEGVKIEFDKTAIAAIEKSR